MCRATSPSAHSLLTERRRKHLCALGIELSGDTQWTGAARRVDRLRGLDPALQDLPYPDVVPALRELRRVLKPDGVLRVAVPDLEHSIKAWCRGDAAYFYIPDVDARSVGSKLIVQAIW